MYFLVTLLHQKIRNPEKKTKKKPPKSQPAEEGLPYAKLKADLAFTWKFSS